MEWILIEENAIKPNRYVVRTFFYIRVETMAESILRTSSMNFTGCWYLRLQH